MPHADVLHQMLMLVIQLIKVTVYLREIQILVIVVLQVLHRRRLASRERQTALHELAEHIVLYLIEAYTVEHTVQYQLRTIDKDIVDVRNYAFRHLFFRFARPAILAIQIKFRMHLQLTLAYPLQTLLTKRGYLRLIFGDADSVQFLVATA